MNSPDRPEFLDVARRNYSLEGEVRMRIGGNAAYFAEVGSRGQLMDAIAFSEEQKLPFFILGKGSNVILSDNGFNGIVLRLVGEFERVSFDDESSSVTAGAGASLIKLGVRLAQEGYEGFTYMGVIPGTVGGAVRINAGTTREGEIKDRFLSADILSSDGWTPQTLNAEKMRVGYRTSTPLRSRDIVLSASFLLPEERESSPGKALADVKQANSRRRAKQPRSLRTAILNSRLTWTKRSIRNTLLVLGAFVARTGKGAVPHPGGCDLGDRKYDLHEMLLRGMGAEVWAEDDMLCAEVKGRLKGAHILCLQGVSWLDHPPHLVRMRA